MNYLYIFLITLSIILTILGGITDLKNNRNSINQTFTILGYNPSKEHLWHDSLFLLVLAITIKVVFNI